MQHMTQEQRRIADELSEIEIEQLHKATLNFSNQSLEMKKLCATVEIAVMTLLFGIFEKSASADTFITALKNICLAVPVAFYFVDVMLYYYQDRLRNSMDIKMNAIRMRYDITPEALTKERHRLTRSVFNASHLVYLALFIITYICIGDAQ